MSILRVELVSSLEDVRAEEWDVLAGQDDPFVLHAFLLALETSRTVTGTSGWEPMHVTVRRGSELVGALPLYVKEHSYGEFIFDWSWASASAKLGAPYYPKLVSMVPVTPATGRRVLLRDDDDVPVLEAIARGIHEAAQRTESWSAHVLFLREDERDALVAASRATQAPLRPRLSHQFHWTNEGYRTFDDFVAKFRAPLRKQLRKERAKVAESGLRIEVREGAQLTESDWAALSTFYLDTCERKGSPAYLTPQFFEEMRRTFSHHVVAVMAYSGDEPVAGSLNFERGKHLYGRYWGALEAHDSLHFELCYYRLIERAIERGYTRFEAGAQGLHKLRRGLMPAPVHSLHWIRHPALKRAVDEFLPREAFAVTREIEELAQHGPFHRDDST